MSWQLWLVIILLALSAGFEMFGLGLPEKDAKYRFLAMLTTCPLSAPSHLGHLFV